VKPFKVKSSRFRIAGVKCQAALFALCTLNFALAVSATPTPSNISDTGAHTAAPTSEGGTAPVQKDSGNDMKVDIKGKLKQQVQVGKTDPPAAFNLEDIQNFPEERLQPVLNSPLNFEEGRDFSSMMDFHEDQLVHPWLPELSKAPFLSMKTQTDKPAKEWTFSIIDQSGNTVSQQTGKGEPSAVLYWNGDDSQRGSAAVDTVYIPQLAISDKDGYHHTYMGQPVQFSSIIFKEAGKTVMELSSKRLFQDNKADFTKEAFTLLDKICDEIREDARLPFAIQPYEQDADLARSRQQAVAKYFEKALDIPEAQVVLGSPANADKRGAAIAILMNATPGGSN